MQQICRNKVVVNARKEAMKQRGQYRYDNMDATEKTAYVAKFGKPPAQTSSDAYRKWAAQAEGQKPYVPTKR
jgi:hypothetical protein